MPLPLRHWILAFSIPLLFLAAVFFRIPGGVTFFGPEDFPPEWRDFSREEYASEAAVAAGPELARADFVILGNSYTRESLWEDRALSPSGRTLQLVHSGQNFLEALFLLHGSGLRRGQTVFILVSPEHFDRGERRSQWRIRKGVFLKNPSAFVRDYQEAIPSLKRFNEFPIRQKTILRMIRNALYFRLLFPIQRAVWGSRPSRYRFESAVPGDKMRTLKHGRKVRSVLKQGFKRNRDSNEKILELLVSEIRSRGAEGVLMENPKLPVDFPDSEWRSDYRKLLGDFAARHSLNYLDLNESVSWTLKDFADSRHTSASGRDKWSRAFIGHLPKT